MAKLKLIPPACLNYVRDELGLDPSVVVDHRYVPDENEPRYMLLCRHAGATEFFLVGFVGETLGWPVCLFDSGEWNRSAAEFKTAKPAAFEGEE